MKFTFSVFRVICELFVNIYLYEFVLSLVCVRVRCFGLYWLSYIGGFRDTYLGRQVVSRPGGSRAGMGSAGGLGALQAPLAGFGVEPQPKSNLLPFSPKISHQVATISIIFNAMQTTNFKVKNIWGGNASPASPLNPPMHMSTVNE